MLFNIIKNVAIAFRYLQIILYTLKNNVCKKTTTERCANNKTMHYKMNKKIKKYVYILIVLIMIHILFQTIWLL